MVEQMKATLISRPTYSTGDYSIDWSMNSLVGKRYFFYGHILRKSREIWICSSPGLRIKCFISEFQSIDFIRASLTITIRVVKPHIIFGLIQALIACHRSTHLHMWPNEERQNNATFKVKRVTGGPSRVDLEWCISKSRFSWFKTDIFCQADASVSCFSWKGAIGFWMRHKSRVNSWLHISYETFHMSTERD